jgi:hypothetical protein
MMLKKKYLRNAIKSKAECKIDMSFKDSTNYALGSFH